MTPNDVKVAVTEILANGMSLSTTAYALFILSWVIASAFGAFLGGFSGKRGETAAVKRDLNSIKESLRQTTALTERIKAEMSGDLWERQNRWTFKRDLYIRLLENLGAARIALDYLYDTQTIYNGMESEARTKRVADEQGKRHSALDDIQRATAVAALILNAEALAALAKLEREVAEAANAESYFHFVDEQLSAVKEAYEVLKSAARADLVLEA
jgi:hypothetical protein